MCRRFVTFLPFATPSPAALARSEHIDKDVEFSGHAPITLDYDFDL
jgi:exodeoxyribonuclease-3